MINEIPGPRPDEAGNVAPESGALQRDQVAYRGPLKDSIELSVEAASGSRPGTLDSEHEAWVPSSGMQQRKRGRPLKAKKPTSHTFDVFFEGTIVKDSPTGSTIRKHLYRGPVVDLGGAIEQLGAEEDTQP